MLTKRRQTQRTARRTRRDFTTLRTWGASKPTSEKAKNALMLDDAFDTFTRHVSDMATYNAWAEATKDAMRWYNYQDHETGGA